jgi:hypothetical protein
MNGSWSEIVKAHVRTAMQNLKDDGYLVPLIIAYRPDSQPILIDMRFRDDSERERCLARATVILALNEVRRYLSLSDAWMVESAADLAATSCRPSAHPNRVEALIAAWRDGHKRGIKIYAYDRHPNGNVRSFRRWQGPPGIDCGGAFLDLIPDTPLENGGGE